MRRQSLENWQESIRVSKVKLTDIWLNSMEGLCSFEIVCSGSPEDGDTLYKDKGVK